MLQNASEADRKILRYGILLNFGIWALIIAVFHFGIGWP